MNNTPTSMRNKEEVRQSGADLKQKAEDFGSAALDKGKEFAGQAADKAKGLASTAAEKAKDAAHVAGDKADDAVAAVGSGMKSLAGSVREHLPSHGMLGSASSAVARGLENSGRYLEEEGISGIAEDMTNLIRRNPIPAVLIGIGLGFLVARSMRS